MEMVLESPSSDSIIDGSEQIIRVRELDDVIICLVHERLNITKWLEQHMFSHNKPLLVLISSINKGSLGDFCLTKGAMFDHKISLLACFEKVNNVYAKKKEISLLAHNEEQANTIISDYLLTHFPKSRPLNLYRTNFFLPLIPFGYDRQNLALLPEPSDQHSFNYKDYSNSPCYSQFAPEENEDCWLHTQSQSDTQAYYYFSQSIRNLLFDIQKPDTTTQALKEWRADPHRSKPLTLSISSDNPHTKTKVRISTLRLYRYFNGVSILSFSVKPDLPLRITLPTDETWWHWLLFSTNEQFESISMMQVERWLVFTRLARVLYPSYHEQKIEGKIAEIKLSGKETDVFAFGEALTHSQNITLENLNGDSSAANNNRQPLNNVLRTLLLQFYTDETSKNEAISWLDSNFGLDDDRMFSSSSYALSGPTPSGPILSPQQDETISNFRTRQLYHLALHVDRYDDTWQDFDELNYNPDYLEEFSHHSTYRLWEQKGLLFGFTNHSCTWIGHDGFYLDPIATKHIPHIYEKMVIQGLFYRTSLRWYSHRISADTNHLRQDFNQDNTQYIENLRGEFLEFTNLYWFNDHTEQMQGKTLSRLLHHGLELDREYAFIKEEIERVDEFCRLKQARIASDSQERLSKGGLVLAIIASFVALITLMLDSLAIAVTWTKSNLMELGITGWLLTALPAFIFLLVVSRAGLGFFMDIEKLGKNRFDPFFKTMKKRLTQPFIGISLLIDAVKRGYRKFTNVIDK